MDQIHYLKPFMDQIQYLKTFMDQIHYLKTFMDQIHYLKTFMDQIIASNTGNKFIIFYKYIIYGIRESLYRYND